MKKVMAVALALMLCLITLGASAANIEVEEMLLDGGLCCVIPAEWTLQDLTEDDFAQGYLLMSIEEDTGRCMLITQQEIDPDTTNADLLAEAKKDPMILTAQLVSNEHDTEVVLYALADETLVSYRLLDGEGKMYEFVYLYTTEESLSSDTELLALVDTCIANTYFDDDLAEYDEETEEPEAVAQGEIALQMVNMTDGPSFPIPAGWHKQSLSPQDQAAGCVASYADPATGRSMLVMANELGNYTTRQLAQMMADNDHYATARLVTNEHDLDMVLFVMKEFSSGGYCFVDEDGWMYTFSFGFLDGSVMTDDDVLAQLVQDCMANTMFR